MRPIAAIVVLALLLTVGLFAVARAAPAEALAAYRERLSVSPQNCLGCGCGGCSCVGCG